MPACQYLRECRRLVRVWRENSQKLRVSMVSNEIFDRRLAIHSGRDRELASGGQNFAGGHAEMF